MSTPSPRRELPQLLIGLVALAAALAVAGPVTAVVVMDGVRDVKRTRDTIVVTGSSKEPIEANLAIWDVSVSAVELSPEDAAIAVGRKADAVETFVRDGGLAGDMSKPPLFVEETSMRVPTGLKKPAFRSVPAWRVAQRFRVQTERIDDLEKIAGKTNRLLLQGVDISVEPIEYLSTQLTEAKFSALRLATADASRRASTIAKGLGGSLGAVRSVHLGVFQITPRNSTDVSDYGINDTSTREKDVTAVVTVTFAVNR